MANWKDIFRKMDEAPVEGPQSSDWEDMYRKIQAQPDLNTPKRKRGFIWGAGIGVVLVGALATGLWLWPGGSATPEQSVAPVQQELNQPLAQPQSSEPVKPVKPAEPSVSSGPETISHSQLKNEGRSEEPVNPGSGGIPDVAEEPGSPAVRQDKISKPEQKTSAPASTGLAGSEDREAKAGQFVSESRSQVQRLESQAPSPEKKSHKARQVLTASKSPIQGSPQARPDDEGEPSITTLIPEALNFKGSGIDSLAPASALPEAELVTEEDRTISKPGWQGFKLDGINVSAVYLSDLKTDFSAMGFGVDADFRRKGLLLNTGVHRLQRSVAQNFISGYERDSTYYSHTEIRWEQKVDSLWVVRGPYTGEYLYDTSYVELRDTVSYLVIDTIPLTATRDVRVQYLQFPVLAGYRFAINKFSLDLMGGALLSYVRTSGTGDLTIPADGFGVDAVFQPGLRYYIGSRLSVFGRAGLRYRLSDATPYAIGEDFRYQFQLGISWHW